MKAMELLAILQKTGISASSKSFSQYDIEEYDAFWAFNAYMYNNFPNFDYEISTGATKAVIVPKNEDYVLKIPFAGDCDWDDQPREYNEETGEYEYDDDWDAFQPFEIEDYCKVELENYQNSIVEGLNMCFAAIEFLGNAGEFPVYMQEKVETFWYSNSRKRHSAEEVKKLKASYTNADLERIPAEWAIDFIEAYGEEKFIEFLIFTMDYHINDLHGDNVAYRNGKPVLSDYSGFWH